MEAPGARLGRTPSNTEGTLRTRQPLATERNYFELRFDPGIPLIRELFLHSLLRRCFRSAPDFVHLAWFWVIGIWVLVEDGPGL